MLNGSTHKRLLGLAAIAVLAVACSSPGAATTAPSASAPAASEPAASESASASAAAQYTIGFSNTGGTGNGFREEQNCTAKAEALASGQVTKVDMIARDEKFLASVGRSETCTFRVVGTAGEKLQS